MTEIETEQEMTRGDVADYLREFAGQLDTAAHAGESPETTADARDRSDEHSPLEHGDDDGSHSHPQAATSRDTAADSRVTFMVGADSATIDPPERVTMDVAVDSDSSLVGGDRKETVEFELSWTTEEAHDEDGADDLEIR